MDDQGEGHQDEKCTGFAQESRTGGWLTAPAVARPPPAEHRSPAPPSPGPDRPGSGTTGRCGCCGPADRRPMGKRNRPGSARRPPPWPGPPPGWRVPSGTSRLTKYPPAGWVQVATAGSPSRRWSTSSTSANFGRITSRCLRIRARTPSADPRNRACRSWLSLSGPIDALGDMAEVPGDVGRRTGEEGDPGPRVGDLRGRGEDEDPIGMAGLRGQARARPERAVRPHPDGAARRRCPTRSGSPRRPVIASRPAGGLLVVDRPGRVRIGRHGPQALDRGVVGDQPGDLVDVGAVDRRAGRGSSRCPSSAQIAKCRSYPGVGQRNLTCWVNHGRFAAGTP